MKRYSKAIFVFISQKNVRRTQGVKRRNSAKKLLLFFLSISLNGKLNNFRLVFENIA